MCNNNSLLETASLSVTDLVERGGFESDLDSNHRTPGNTEHPDLESSSIKIRVLNVIKDFFDRLILGVNSRRQHDLALFTASDSLSDDPDAQSQLETQYQYLIKRLITLEGSLIAGVGASEKISSGLGSEITSTFREAYIVATTF